MLELGKERAAVLRELDVSASTLDRWRAKYAPMMAEDARSLRELENENRRLRHLVVDQAFEIQMLKQTAERS